MAATALTLQKIQNEVSTRNENSSEADIKKCEDLILEFAKQLSAEKDAAGLKTLMLSIRSFYEAIGKARASKLMRELVELCLAIDQGKVEKIEMVKSCVEWASSNHREFLRRSLQARLVKLYNEVKEYTEAQKLAQSLIKELKKLEDRELMMEVALEDSKSAFNLNNFSKARCALVLAKTNSNAVFVSPQVQAAVDMQSGVLHSAEDRDFKTSYSYFFEAFEGYHALNDKKNEAFALKYMILCKIMLNETDSIKAMLASKEMSSVTGAELDSMCAMAEAFRKRCLKSFQKSLKDFKKELVEDKVVSVHSQHLEKTMLEKEITRVIEPYSVIELSFIARVIDTSVPPIEKALAKMILDKKVFGCIDQHSGTVIIYPAASTNKEFVRTLGTIREVTKTVDASYERTKYIQ